MNLAEESDFGTFKVEVWRSESQAESYSDDPKFTYRIFVTSNDVDVEVTTFQEFVRHVTRMVDDSDFFYTKYKRFVTEFGRYFFKGYRVFWSGFIWDQIAKENDIDLESLDPTFSNGILRWGTIEREDGSFSRVFLFETDVTTGITEKTHIKKLRGPRKIG